MANTDVKRRREKIVVHNAAVATDDKRCSEIAKNILYQGGNAIDAAVAAALSLGVVSLASSGIGGGAFLLLKLKDKEAVAFDMRETAPQLAFEDMYHGNELLKAIGALSIGVPGELAGLHQAWKEYGSRKLSWRSLVEPAEKLARGFIISDYLAWEMRLMEPAIRKDKGLSEILIGPDGQLLKSGDTCRDVKLAKTLQKISEEGIEPFYNGEIGRNLTADIKDLGGIINMEDLRNYKVKKREPLVSFISGLGIRLIGMPPPSAGGAGITLMLKILDQYKDCFDVSSPLGVHRKIEALKHVFAMRLNIGDPDFVNCSGVVSAMLSDEFALKLKNTIDDNQTFDPCHYGDRWNELYKFPMPEHGTSHISIVDQNGNAVALTTSLNNYFGAQIRSLRTGIVLNNQMDDFSIPFPKVCPTNNQPANYIFPGKRPLSSMSPTIIIKDKKLNAVVGGSGGVMIIPGVAEVILNYFFDEIECECNKMDELKSVMNPRCYPRLVPNEVHYEDFKTVTNDHIKVPIETLEALQRKRHHLKKLDTGAVCQFITYKELFKENLNACVKRIVAVSDPRKGGVPAGF